MKATRVFKSFEAISQDQIAELTGPAVSSAAAPLPKESSQPSEPREQWRADDRETGSVQPYRHWGINE